MAGPRGLTIAIDGVVGAGKSSAARGLAGALGYRHLDTGAMYRAVALAAARRGIEPGDAGDLKQLLGGLRLELEPRRDGVGVLLDGQDVSADIRRPEVARRVGAFADLPAVRRDLVARQRAIGDEGGVVADGRDMGTVVFPGADLKVHLTASEEERARRRHLELVEAGISTTPAEVLADLRRRDEEDRQRDYRIGDAAREETAATDVVEFDTTGLDLGAVIERLVAWSRDRGA